MVWIWHGFGSSGITKHWKWLLHTSPFLSLCLFHLYQHEKWPQYYDFAVWGWRWEGNIIKLPVNQWHGTAINFQVATLQNIENRFFIQVNFPKIVTFSFTPKWKSYQHSDFCCLKFKIEMVISCSPVVECCVIQLHQT